MKEKEEKKRDIDSLKLRFCGNSLPKKQKKNAVRKLDSD